jgi:hypothetical protein
MEIDNVPPPPEEKWGFIDKLIKPEKRYFHWPRKSPCDEEVSLLCGVSIKRGATDPLLDTAYRDLSLFFDQAGLKKGPFQIVTETGETVPYDSFRVKVEKGCCRITAGNTDSSSE